MLLPWANTPFIKGKTTFVSWPLPLVEFSRERRKHKNPSSWHTVMCQELRNVQRGGRKRWFLCKRKWEEFKVLNLIGLDFWKRYPEMGSVWTNWHVALPEWHLRAGVSSIQLEDAYTAVKLPLLAWCWPLASCAIYPRGEREWRVTGKSSFEGKTRSQMQAT